MNKTKVKPLETWEEVRDAVLEVMIASEVPYYETKDAIKWVLDELRGFSSRDWYECILMPLQKGKVRPVNK